MFSGRDEVGNANDVQVSWHLWSYSVMPTVKIGALFCPKYIQTSIIFSGNAQSFRGLGPLDPHQGLAPGPHQGPKVGPWTPPVMGFAPRRSPCTLCVHQIFSQFLYNFGRATFKSWLTPCFLWKQIELFRKNLCFDNNEQVWLHKAKSVFKKQLSSVVFTCN